MKAGAGNDQVTGSSATYSTGDNTQAFVTNIIDGEDGADTITGGAGYNALYGANGDDLINGGGASDSLNGGDGNDTLNGGNGNDTLDGDSGNDSLVGGAGNDFLEGGGGLDTIVGGEGLDTLAVLDLIATTAAATIDLSALNINVANISGIEQVQTIYAGAGNDQISAAADDLLGHAFSGNNGADRLTGGGGDDKLFGGNDNDTLAGANGADIIDGDDGDDVVIGGNGNDSLYGANNNDTLEGGDGNDFLDGGDGNDSLLGGAGNDTLAGGAGQNIIDGGDGIDFVSELDLSATTDAATLNFSNINNYGLKNIEDIGKVYTGSGNDLIDASSTTSNYHRFSGNDGNDTIISGSGRDALFGGLGNDSLVGAAGSDRLYGDVGDDTLSGGDGRDILNGLTGNDVLTGGSDRDLFVLGHYTGINPNQLGRDVITDFEVGVDKIVIHTRSFPQQPNTRVPVSFSTVSDDEAVQASLTDFTYNSSTGSLFFRPGLPFALESGPAIELVSLANRPNLTQNDLFSFFPPGTNVDQYLAIIELQYPVDLVLAE